MRGGHTHGAQHVGHVRRLANGPASHRANLREAREKAPRGGVLEARRRAREEARKARQARVYLRRRLAAAGVVLIVALTFVLAVFAQASEAADRSVPIDPANAAPDTVLARVGEVDISTPIRPSDITGIGYHPDGDDLLEMEPRGKNLSSNPLLRLLGGGTPEDIRYYEMDPAGRDGPGTGALDVGAPVGTTVYSPVDGVVTAIRPDPMVSDANVIEIKPSDNPDVRVTVSLVKSTKDGAGVKSPVTAGKTELGTVADSAEVLKPQLASYTNDAGNHVTVHVSRY